VRSGVECAFRSSAAVDVLFSAGLLGLWLKRSGLGVNVDLMPRTHTYESAGVTAWCWARGIRAHVAVDSEGKEPQLRGARGGIVCCGASDDERSCLWRCSRSGNFWR
jgi:hypothetical protein